MKTKLGLLVSCLMFVLFLSGCWTVSRDRDKGIAVERDEEAIKEAKKQGTLAGVIVPAEEAAGAPITGALEKTPAEVPEGSFSGVLTGSKIGTYRHDLFSTRPETIATYHYEETQGVVLHVEDAFTQLPAVHPGDEIDLNMKYAVLTPYHDVLTPITEVREIKFNGQTVGTITVHVTRGDGTYTSIVPLKIPGAQEEIGEYQVTETVQAANAQAAKDMKFNVVNVHQPLGENLPGTRTYGE